MEHGSFMFLYIFILFTGPPPIPAEPVVSPEPVYVSKIHYGKKVLHNDIFLEGEPNKKL